MAMTVTQHKSGHSIANATTVDITMTSTASGAVLVVGCANAGTRTVSTVTDNTGSNTYTQATGAAASANAGVDATDMWYCLAPASGVTTITITYTGAAGTFVKDGTAWEVAGFITPAFDVGGGVSNLTQTTGSWNGPTINAGGTKNFIAAETKGPAGLVIDVNPAAGNEFTSGGDIASGTDSAGCSLKSAASGNHTPAWHSGNSFIDVCASAVSIKETAAPTGNIEFVTSNGVTVGTAASTWSMVPGGSSMLGGGAIVVGIGVGSSAVTVSTITDNTTNLYLKAIARGSPLPAAGAELWYAMGYSTASTRISVTLSGSASGSIAYSNWDGFSTQNALGPTGSSGNSTNSTAHSITEVTSTSTGALVISFNRTNVSTISPIRVGSGYTAWVSTNNAVRTFGEYWIQGAASTATAPWTNGAAGGSSGQCLFSGVSAIFYSTVVIGGGGGFLGQPWTFTLMGVQ